MYIYYQRRGGEEVWSPIQVSQRKELDTLKPTFTTVLQLDTLIPEHPSRELLDKVRYYGPMYWDLDSESIEDSLADAVELLEKLAELGVEDQDLEIYLSGKKGVHILLAPNVFMEKPAPTVRLMAVYKELAFRLAVDTIDFNVYSGRKGRMLRTCYNQRDNGAYRVPVTANELRSLNSDTYALFCSAPRTVEPPTPAFRWKFALEYDKAAARIPKPSSRRSTPLAPDKVRGQWPSVQPVFEGVELREVGFNKIAIQLALYARDAEWSADTLVEKAGKLLDGHQSDGYRYNTPSKREAELRRMFDYVADNPAYDYSLQGVLSLLQTRGADTDFDEIEEAVHASGVNRRGGCYTATKADDAETQITNFVFTDVGVIKDLEGGFIISLMANMSGLTNSPVALYPSSFTGSSSLQNAVAPYGGSFTGTDAHARGIFQLMLKESGFSKFLVGTEGVNLLKLSNNVPEALHGQQIVVWADRNGVQLPEELAEAGLELAFQGYPDPQGVLRTDLSQSPGLGQFAEGQLKEDLITCVKSLIACHPPETVGKLLGWMVACHWKQLFQAAFDKFPLLHVYGPAGAGKTEITMNLLRLFYCHEEPKSVTPSGTPFSFMSLVAGSASIPIVLDEYKPHRMAKDKLESYRAVLRDGYNGKSVTRGGGTRGKDSYNSLHVTHLSGPIGFIAEAVETETAIVERSLLVAVRRQPPRAAAEGLQNFLRFSANVEPLSAIGKHIAGWVVNSATVATLRAEFGAMHEWALRRFMLQPDDNEKLRKGQLSQEQYNQKMMGRPRPIYNSTVAMFGLVQLRKVLQKLLGDSEFDVHFGESFKTMAKAVYDNMDVVAKTSIPEYVKVLQTVADITRSKDDTSYAMREHYEYNITEVGERLVLVFHVRSVYNKYSAYMRIIGAQPLYPSDTSFDIALTETHQFIGYGEGTRNLPGKTIMLDYEELQRAGMPAFSGKPVPAVQG